MTSEKSTGLTPLEWRLLMEGLVIIGLLVGAFYWR